MNRLIARIRARVRHGADSEQGWVLVTAVIVMAIMLGVGLAFLATADTQSGQSRLERVRESAFNLGEGLLEAESGILQHNWPTQPPCGVVAGCGYVTQCTEAAGSIQCPYPASLAQTTGAFANVDQASGTTWKVQVRDDVGVGDLYGNYFPKGQVPSYYKGTGTSPPGVDQLICGPSNNQLCTWDANGDKQMWVRVDATTHGKTRSMVALLHLENFTVPFPANAVTGGAVNFSNAGNKTIVDAQSDVTGKIVVRCRPTQYTKVATQNSVGATTLAIQPAVGVAKWFNTGDVVALDEGNRNTYEVLTVANSTGTSVTFNTGMKFVHAVDSPVSLAPDPSANSCENWTSPLPPDKNGSVKNQLDPAGAYISDPNAPPALSSSLLTLVELGAKTYTNACPPDDGWTGNVVIKLAPTTGCVMPKNTTINDPSHFGFVIVEDQAPANSTGACPGPGAVNGPALTLSGGTAYYGVIYMVNKQCAGKTDKPVVFLNGNAQIQGGIAVDGQGGVQIGQATGGSNCVITTVSLDCPTLVYDPHAFKGIGGAGAAGLVQNTWRELAPNQ